MLLNYLRFDRDYTPKEVDKETKRLFDMELKHWEVASEDYYK